MDMFETYEVTLTTLTYGGDAMGRLEDGRAVFVPFGLPGERVQVRLTEEKRGFAREKSSKYCKLHRKNLTALQTFRSMRRMSLSAYAV